MALYTELRGGSRKWLFESERESLDEFECMGTFRSEEHTPLVLRTSFFSPFFAIESRKTFLSVEGKT